MRDEMRIGVQVNAFDCLLLEFVFGNRPDDAQKVRQRVLDIISSDPGLQQTELVFLGLFGRACRVLESPESQVGPRAINHHCLTWSQQRLLCPAGVSLYSGCPFLDVQQCTARTQPAPG